ncbi:MAG: SpoIIE family protein phosphatase, partial [Rectinemataceae bacterium]
DPASSFILADFLDDAGRTTAVYIQDQVAANEVWRRRMNDAGAWAAPEAMGFTALSDPARRGATSFAYAVTMAGRLYALWQYDDQVGTRNAPLVRQRIFLLEPVLHVDPPAISVPNYVSGRRSRDEVVTVVLRMPETSAGIGKVVSLWTRTGDAMLEGYPGGVPGREGLWSKGTVINGSPGSLSLRAPEDGAWALAVSVEDNAGNRSVPVTLTWFRDRTPPDPPIILPPSLDAGGSILSNSGDIAWLPPLADDTQGYTWTLVGPLDLAGITKEARRPGRSVIEGQSPIEAAIIERYGLPRPPPAIQGRSPLLVLDNIDDGYWLLSVAAIDGTANISDISTVLFRADKQVPFTLVTDIRQTTDLIGRRSLSIIGRGFTDQGSVTRVVLTKSRAEPWDFRRELATGGFSISSNRLIEEVAVEDIPEGEYWLGIQHPLRGMYWAPRRVTFDASGTLKYGIEYEYRPSWTLAPQPSSRYSIYDFIVAAAWIFFGLGIFLSLWQAVATLRDAQSVRLQVLALVGGGPMPDAVKDKAIRKAAVRGGGLTLRFTFFIAILILMVVLLVAFSLGISMVRNQSAALARGLEDATRVLLESAAQGGRFFLDREGAVTQLGFLPTQVKALPGAEYITITGNSQDPKVAGRDIVFSTNDPAIAGKISSSRLELGVSPMNLTVDPLASKTPDMARELETKSAEAIKGDLDRKAELQKQKTALPTGAAGDEDRKRLNASLDEIDRTIRDRLRAISDEAVDSVPAFDPTVLSQTATSYLFFKPILEYRPGDSILYRGMVRLSANTALIVADVAARTTALILSTAQIAALVLLGGILGAFFLARSIVRPIREIVAKIDTMRTTEDKASLAGFDIVVRGRDEIATLALAAKALAVELVEGAKQSHALIEGSDIQNHFIPLLKEGTITLSIAKESGKYHEMYGYYKGAKKVSGDYWNFEKLDAEGKYYYFIKCDVSGKDVAAAFIMVQVGTIVINHFNEWQRLQRIPDFELVKLTYRVNDFLVARDYKGKFAAFTIGVINLADGSIQLCHAGDNMYRVWKASTGTTVSAPFQPDLRKSSPATGLIPQDMMELGGTGFYSYRRTLEHGDILLLYSDGMEDPIHRFRDAGGTVRQCAELPGAADMDHKELHHDPGDAEHLGPERLDAFIEAYDKREVFSLRHDHETDRDLVMSFDFTKATGSLEERLISYLGVGKVFSIYDWNAGDDATILVDRRIDKFLSVFFDQYSLVFRKKESITVKTGRKDREGKDEIVEDPNYFLFRGIREDEQYDDLSIVGILRK